MLSNVPPAAARYVATAWIIMLAGDQFIKNTMRPLRRASPCFIKANVSLVIVGIEISFIKLPDPRWLANRCSAANDVT